MLWLKGGIVYIGKAKNIRNRVSWRALDKKAFDEVSFIPVPNETQRDYLESVLIDFLRPKLNKVMPIITIRPGPSILQLVPA
jgi:excinuclease UvrABC nuclease subunit